MNGFRAIFASATAMLAAMAATGVLAAPTTPPTPAPQTTAARQSAPYPSLASVPPKPTDVRPVSAWKTAVLASEAQRDELMKLAAAEPWTLHDTDAWAAEEREAASPPPPITTASSQADTEAFAAALRARATPPPRKR